MRPNCQEKIIISEYRSSLQETLLKATELAIRTSMIQT